MSKKRRAFQPTVVQDGQLEDRLVLSPGAAGMFAMAGHGINHPAAAEVRHLRYYRAAARYLHLSRRASPVTSEVHAAQANAASVGVNGGGFYVADAAPNFVGATADAFIPFGHFGLANSNHSFGNSGFNGNGGKFNGMFGSPQRRFGR